MASSGYRGWDPQLDREVAVKLLPTRAGPSPPLEDARNLALVRHPNVVTVYGADQDADQTGIWMEDIVGETLADLVADRGPMSAGEATGIGSDLAGALSALHVRHAPRVHNEPMVMGANTSSVVHAPTAAHGEDTA